jgi:phosphatidylglycerophosphatase A
MEENASRTLRVESPTERAQELAVWIATCGPVGYLPIPGTFGAALGLALVVAVAHVPGLMGRQSLTTAVVALMIAALFTLGVAASTAAESYFGRVDPGQVVIDEVVGQMLALIIRPGAPWLWLLLGFLIFRVLDILKPFPARRAEHLPGGWGIMVDDVVAGAYSIVTLVILSLVWK